jgi:hypothetical protein
VRNGYYINVLPVAKYKLVSTTGTLDCAILDELWLCEECLPRAIRKEIEQ